MDLKGEKALFEIGQRRKVIRGEDFPLNDREVDLHPIESTGVGRGVDEDCIGPLSAEAINGPLAPMNGTVVHDPEDASRGLVGLLAHDFANQAIHRRDAILGLATTEELGAVDIPGSQVNPGAPESTRVPLSWDGSAQLGCRVPTIRLSAHLRDSLCLGGRFAARASQDPRACRPQPPHALRSSVSSGRGSRNGVVQPRVDARARSGTNTRGGRWEAAGVAQATF